MNPRDLLPPSERAFRAAQRLARDGTWDDTPGDLEEVAAGVAICRRCELWREGTQGVAGEGPATARLMIVGDQPGDQEDRAGRPFVGPAGHLLDRALAIAEIGRDRVFLTNAVKHFRHEARGGRRLRRTPTGGDVSACRWWLSHERRLVRPRVILALGAIAARSVFGRPVAVGDNLGMPLSLPGRAIGMVTWHPAYLLRLSDEAARTDAWRRFVIDLKRAATLAG